MGFIQRAALSLSLAGVPLAVGLSQSAAGCALPARCLPVRLPAPISITAGPRDYRITRDGRVQRVAPPRSPYPGNATLFQGTSTWYRFQQGHLVVGRGYTALWRSRETIAVTELGLVAAGPHGVAFQHDHWLYVARYGDAERPVARREMPIGWTAGGLFTYSYPRREALLRSVAGRIVRVIAWRPQQYQFDPGRGNLYFVRRGALVGAQGARVRRLAGLRRLGMSDNVELTPLAGLVELFDGSRLVVVRPSGSVFASAPVGRLDRISSFVAVAPDRSAVAFAGDTGHGPAGAPNVESVYLLRAGAHTATAVHRERGSYGGCAYWADVEWQGSWLLYSNNAGNLAAIDTAGAHRTIELTHVARRLAGWRQGFDAQWTR